jgi:hypothetical protein
VDDDGNPLGMIVIEELTLPTIVRLSRTVTTYRRIVLPRRPTPLNEEHVALRKSRIIILDAGIGFIIATLLHLDHGVTATLHLIDEINTTPTIMVGRCGHSLLLERGYKAPE